MANEAINIAPSQYWEGNDGPWSTFAVQIGNPPQTVRVLPSSSGSAIWTVLAEGCMAQGDPSDCAIRRGLIYDFSNSTTYRRVGGVNSFFRLSYETEASLGYAGNSVVGFDNVELGWPGAGAPKLSDQVIVGFADKSSMFGFLGLTPRPVNVTNFIDRHASPLGTLVNVNKTLSNSYWAYHAGAQYRSPSTTASLVLGGYDEMRGDMSKALQVPIAADTNRDLVVAINAIDITTPGTAANISVSGLPILALVDSVVPDIWLPRSACRAFESAFGLIYNSTASKYWINETQHNALLAQNSSVTFTLGASTSATQLYSVTLPYASFDLTASYPVGGLDANQTSRYFPLQRAENSTQFTIGRTFFQEAYVSVDYSRNTFYISQASFPSDPSASKIVTVRSPADEAAKHKFPIGGIVGIVIAIAMIFLAVLAWLLVRRRRRNAEARERHLEAKLSAADEAARRRLAADIDKFKPELDATTTAVGRDRGRWELDDSAVKSPWSGSEGQYSSSDDEKVRPGTSPGGTGVGTGVRTYRRPDGTLVEVPDNMLSEALGQDGAFEMKGDDVVRELDSRMRAELDGGQGGRGPAAELPAHKF